MTNLDPCGDFGKSTITARKFPTPSAVTTRVSENEWVGSRVSTVVRATAWPGAQLVPVTSTVRLGATTPGFTIKLGVRPVRGAT